jgi:hypothetical protein
MAALVARQEAAAQQAARAAADAAVIASVLAAGTRSAEPAPLPFSSPGSSAGEVIESQIDGSFQGWNGETVFVLVNGQVWQQASYAYHYHYAYRPKVLIFRGRSGYQLKVDGVENTILVRRLR